MINVIIADDHAIVREGMSKVVGQQKDMRLIGTAEDGPELLEQLERQACTVVVLDLSLPTLGGLELVRRVKRHFSARIVVFSMYPEDQFALQLIEAGAHAYINKTRSPKELLEAIRSAAAGERYMPSGIEHMAINRKAKAKQDSDKLPHERLSAREFQVFLMLVEGQAVGDVARALKIAVSTASNHVSKVKDKLGVTSVAGIVHYAARMGLIPSE